MCNVLIFLTLLYATMKCVCLYCQLEPIDAASLVIFRGHQLSVTCAVISHDTKHLYTASKDCSIIQCKALTYIWSLSSEWFLSVSL